MRFAGDDGALDNSPYSDGVWFNVTWTFVEPPPTGLLLGFEVALFKGSSAADTQNYVAQIVKVHANDRSALVKAGIPRGTNAPTVYASVRPLYGFGPGAWVQAAASATPAPSGTRIASTDNLIPNPTSELGLALAGYGSALVVNDATNSYAGNYCRKLDASATNQTSLTELIPCIYGDEFTFDCYVKGSSATPILTLVLTFYNASGTVMGTSSSAAYTGSTNYQKISVKGSVPLGAMTVQASVKAGTTAASSFLYFDNLSLRRSILFGHLVSDAGFRTINALKNSGTTTADRTWYAGNNDSTTRGGAPNISSLTVTRRRWDTTNKAGRLDLTLQPSSASDNLDGMRPAKVQWYQQSVIYCDSGAVSITVTGSTKTYALSSGTWAALGFANGQTINFSGFTNSGNNGNFTISTVSGANLIVTSGVQINETSASGRCQTRGTMTAVDTTYVPMNDRLFGSTTDSNSANAAPHTAQISDNAISAGVPACIVTLNNAFGPSDSHCYISGSTGADGVALVDNGTSFPSTFPGGGSGGTGGGSGGGGSCVTPETMVDLWDAETSQVIQKRADQIQVGDLVYTIHPTGTVGCWPVTAARVESADIIYAVDFDGGLVIQFAKNHRLRIQGKGWVAVQELATGDMPEGTAPKAVLSVAEGPGGEVVALSVDQAASYQTSGILSSNIKPLN